MKKLNDIETRKDVRLFVDHFYRKVLDDAHIGFIFKDVAKINMDEHMPIMYDFWESTLFQSNIYKGNPMEVHLRLNDKVKLQKSHFEQWLKLFNESIDELFSGEKAELAKTRALSIATVMQIKISR